MSLAMLEISKYITYEVTNEQQNDDSVRLKDEKMSKCNEDEQRLCRLQFERKRRIRRIRVKIGLHSGRVISGVVGAKKPQYALFGDTINTASRMKTTGEADMIHISEATFDLVKDDDSLIWEQREIDVKGKGIMKTYLLTGVPGTEYSGLRECPGVSESDELENPQTSRNPMVAVRVRVIIVTQKTTHQSAALYLTCTIYMHIV